MKVTATVTVDSDEILKGFNESQVVEHFEQHGDVDLLLKAIGDGAIFQYLRKNLPVDIILNELAEVQEIEPHIAELRLWALKQKQAVG